VFVNIRIITQNSLQVVGALASEQPPFHPPVGTCGPPSSTAPGLGDAGDLDVEAIKNRLIRFRGLMKQRVASNAILRELRKLRPLESFVSTICSDLESWKMPTTEEPVVPSEFIGAALDFLVRLQCMADE
jgi:hypothetical protein